VNNRNKWIVGMKCIVHKNPPGIYPYFDMQGKYATIDRVVKKKYVQVDGYRVPYNTASSYLTQRDEVNNG